MSTKALFPCGGGSNLILGICTENKIFILRTPTTIKFFHQIHQKLSLWCKTKKSLSIQIYLYDPCMDPYSILYFQRSTNKKNFLMKFPHLEKIVDLMKHFSLVGEDQT